jgi:chorismate mutase
MADLKQLRQEVDSLDEQILKLLAARVKVCQAIGSAKKAKELPIKDAARESEVYARIRKQAAKLGLNSVQVEQIYREIVNMCSSVQE